MFQNLTAVRMSQRSHGLTLTVGEKFIIQILLLIHGTGLCELGKRCPLATENNGAAWLEKGRRRLWNERFISNFSRSNANKHTVVIWRTLCSPRHSFIWFSAFDWFNLSRRSGKSRCPSHLQVPSLDIWMNLLFWDYLRALSRTTTYFCPAWLSKTSFNYPALTVQLGSVAHKVNQFRVFCNIKRSTF